MKLDKKYLTIVLGALALILLLGIFSTVGTVDLKLNEIISALVNNDNKMVTTIAPNTIVKYFLSNFIFILRIIYLQEFL